MKKQCWSMGAGLLAAMGLVSLARADSLTLYGSMTQGVAYISNIGGGSATRLDPGTMQPDRIGFRGVEHLGDGMQANFHLESGFLTQTGQAIIPGTMFNRNAWVGLSNRWGSLQMGRQPDFLFDVIGRFSNGFQLTNFYLFHPGNFDNLANTFQANNAVKLQSPAAHDLQVGAQYGFSSMTPAGAPRSATTLSSFIRYQSGGWRGALAYTRIKDRAHVDVPARTGVTDLFGQTLTRGQPIVLDRQRIVGAGTGYRFATLPLRLNAVYTDVQLRYRHRDASVRSVDVGAAWDYATRNVLNLGYSQTRFSGGRWNLFSLSHVHQFSKRTDVFALVAYQRAAGGLMHAAMNGVGVSSSRNQTVLSSGLHHSF